MNTDITYCEGYLCPLQEQCRRCIANYHPVAAEDAPLLSWVVTAYDDDRAECDNYYPYED